MLDVPLQPATTTINLVGSMMLLSTFSASVSQFRRPKLLSSSIRPSYLQQQDLSEAKGSGWNLPEASFPWYCPAAESAGRVASELRLTFIFSCNLLS